MTPRIFALTRTDRQRLETLLDSHFVEAMWDERAHLSNLKEKLEAATVVDSREMLPDIVTMNSTVKLFDIDRREAETFTLVYPEEACIAEGKLSILSPLGTEVLGRRVTERFSLQVLTVKTRKRVENISFQPERSGVFGL
ncbi:Regulator of nucleoside diphosphate kinase [Allorhodopirellula heiligendammensis]|uniref:Regulator of nucleoside diphosphate kinase n=1 Tax=Allorhodopirellula heiligendammensis TaxID=2714739 RepID=A0A5C6C7J2_9BACT|nr:Regulator of nucleoside diphosphate kinase [Allorhodopirellula heiligendammensis]